MKAWKLEFRGSNLQQEETERHCLISYEKIINLFQIQQQQASNMQ